MLISVAFLLFGLANARTFLNKVSKDGLCTFKLPGNGSLASGLCTSAADCINADFSDVNANSTECTGGFPYVESLVCCVRDMQPCWMADDSFGFCYDSGDCSNDEKLNGRETRWRCPGQPNNVRCCAARKDVPSPEDLELEYPKSPLTEQVSVKEFGRRYIVTGAQFKKAFPSALEGEKWEPYINEAMEKYHINRRRDRVLSFLSQCAHETRGFAVFIEELSTKQYNDDCPGKHAHPDNPTANCTWIGRGIIQLTHWYWYRAASQVRLWAAKNEKHDFYSNPLDAAKAEFAWELAAIWWSAHKLNSYIDNEDESLELRERRIRSIINGCPLGSDKCITSTADVMSYRAKLDNLLFKHKTADPVETPPRCFAFGTKLALFDDEDGNGPYIWSQGAYLKEYKTEEQVEILAPQQGKRGVCLLPSQCAEVPGAITASGFCPGATPKCCISRDHDSIEHNGFDAVQEYMITKQMLTDWGYEQESSSFREEMESDKSSADWLLPTVITLGALLVLGLGLCACIGVLRRRAHKRSLNLAHTGRAPSHASLHGSTSRTTSSTKLHRVRSGSTHSTRYSVRRLSTKTDIPSAVAVPDIAADEQEPAAVVESAEAVPQSANFI